MKAGDKVVILNHEIVDGPEVFGAVWCVEVDQESGERGKPVMVGVGSIIPDHPALPAVARWLADAAQVDELVSVLYWCIDEAGFSGAAADSIRALLAALTTEEA